MTLIANQQNANGVTPLMKACENGDSIALLYIEQEGIDLNLQNNLGWTALMFACYYGREKIAMRLIEKGVDLDLQNNDGWTAFMFACIESLDSVALMLIGMGCDVNLKTNKGETALDLTQEKNDVIIDALVDAMTEKSLCETFTIGMDIIIEENEDDEVNLIEETIKEEKVNINKTQLTLKEMEHGFQRIYNKLKWEKYKKRFLVILVFFLALLLFHKKTKKSNI